MHLYFVTEGGVLLALVKLQIDMIYYCNIVSIFIHMFYIYQQLFDSKVVNLTVYSCSRH